MPSQSSSSSSKDPSDKRSSELGMLIYGASLEHHRLLEDISSKAYDLGLKAGRGQANLNPDYETQALSLSLTDRNDELEKQVKDHTTVSLLDLAKDVRNNFSAAYRAVHAATHANSLKPEGLDTTC